MEFLNRNWGQMRWKSVWSFILSWIIEVTIFLRRQYRLNSHPSRFCVNHLNNLGRKKFSGSQTPLTKRKGLLRLDNPFCYLIYRIYTIFDSYFRFWIFIKLSRPQNHVYSRPEASSSSPKRWTSLRNTVLPNLPPNL